MPCVCCVVAWKNSYDRYASQKLMKSHVFWKTYSFFFLDTYLKYILNLFFQIHIFRWSFFFFFLYRLENCLFQHSNSCNIWLHQISVCQYCHIYCYMYTKAQKWANSCKKFFSSPGKISLDKSWEKYWAYPPIHSIHYHEYLMQHSSIDFYLNIHCGISLESLWHTNEMQQCSF